ncbi:MAG TPA: cyclic nucleotide-binding domain-containing protein [Acidimicrobiales bacterium]|jgi:CRP-like cAMP-binding protein|nr:cyclic nucleotide-binding domain-containing protein [Acidimicrobiales bacterium]
MRLVKNDLREYPIFADASRSELARVAQLLTMVTVPAGRVLVREGAGADEFIVIVEGEVEVSQGGQTIATLGRGGLVGEMALVQEPGQRRRNATVTALTDMVIYVGSLLEFREILHVAPSVADKVHQTIASRTLVAA